jgi:hypothetical protein
MHAAVKELQRLGQLVIDFQRGGHAEQHEEAEVDHRVHQAGGAVAQQGAHVDAGAVVGQTALDVLRGGATAVRGAAFPVADAVGEAERTPDDHRRDDGVEGDLDRPGDVGEHGAVDLGVALPARYERDDARHHGEDAHSEPDGDRELVRTKALLGLRGF